MYSYSENTHNLLYYSDKIKGGDHLLPIFHGGNKLIEVSGEGSSEHYIDFVQNTKQINIGIESNTFKNISCEIINHNRNYAMNNTQSDILYSLAHDTPSTRSNVTNLSFTTHRLRGVAKHNSSIELYGERNGVRERLFSESLVGILLQNPKITEEILDSQNVFDLAFDFNQETYPGVVIIHIEDYKIIYMPSDLD